MAACDDFRASFGEDLPICWLCQALKERDEALEKARWSDHIAECRGKEIVSREEEIEELQRKLEQMKGNAWPAMCSTLQSMRDEARKERDAVREELGLKRLCPKCEEHYSDPNDLGECPVCETQARNNKLSEMLQEIWEVAKQETGDWQDVGAIFAKLRKEREEARKGVRMMGEELNRVSGDLHAVLLECGQAERERDEVLRDRDEARKAAREYFEASLDEVVGRSCYAEVVEEAYAKYPFLKGMPLDP